MTENQTHTHPFTVAIPQTELDGLRLRLAQTRWPDEIADSGWNYGSNLAYLKELVNYWQTTFDWRRQEQRLNTFAHFRATIDGIGIHFLRVRGKGPRPMPLLLTNGWPSSFVELLGILPALSDPTSWGGDPADAFDVVVPSLPGFGFSDRATEPGMTSTRIARLWSRLMSEVLGYPRFGAHGTDAGGVVTGELARHYPHQVIGIHLPSAFLSLGPDTPLLSEREQAVFAELERWGATEGGFAHVQSTKPQTLAYGLNDSPAGLAAWIVEKFRAWSDCDGQVERRFTRDELLTNVSLYWFTQTINSSMRFYYENARSPRTPFRKGERVEVPCAFAIFDKHLPRSSRELAERVYHVVRWTEMPKGGHFPAYEEPELLVQDLRAFFRPLRLSATNRSAS